MSILLRLVNAIPAPKPILYQIQTEKELAVHLAA
jgi:hypothetical protein